jgi:hypothetical protein
MLPCRAGVKQSLAKLKQGAQVNKEGIVSHLSDISIQWNGYDICLSLEGGTGSNSDAATYYNRSRNVELQTKGYPLPLFKNTTWCSVYCSYDLMRISQCSQLFLLRNPSCSISYRVLRQIDGCLC